MSANQGGSWLSDAWASTKSWFSNHFELQAGIAITQGSIGITEGKFAGEELDWGKHTLMSLNAGTESHGTTLTRGNSDRLYGGQGVLPIYDIPLGLGATSNTATGEKDYSIGIGAFGYERDGSSNFAGVDASRDWGIGIIGVDITFKLGIKW